MTAAADPGRAVYEVLDADRFAAALDDLGEILADSVESGAGVNFVLPFSAADGAAWWRTRIPDVAAGTIRPVIAIVDARIEGVTLLVLSRNPNSPHRAEVSKVLVHRRARGHGLGRGLMAAIEDVALGERRWLLILDTVTDSIAERMYRRLGWIAVGIVPDHSLRPDGELAPTTIFYKDLRSGRAS